ncbi:sulfocyanin-like copper-binding protein [Sulfoacidibacillus thermotolerans]|uniref:Sulfocyanin-like C-terminal domain-containing protein n=1 Tax=Sulfoacidibacillus thermotolerans TaxID=1765684 RepID=A0A2U3D805_SULT2|nr:sulfocyanin-like copper-binding protein [Sulfoacidibacillus thermotolerans]PWI57408.1 hypothetical protein BM613_08770 [Sulfoacidibacillus thermotolerans]
MRFRHIVLGAVALSSIILTGCGTTEAVNPPWFSVNNANQTVDLTIAAGTNSTNGFANFNGYANGQMTVDIPVGYTVQVHFVNDGGIPFDFGIYNSVNKLAFPGAGASVSSMVNDSGAGVFPGQSSNFKFVASQVGDYRMENLLLRIDDQTRPENFGMWDWFDVTNGGTPQVVVSNS